MAAAMEGVPSWACRPIAFSLATPQRFEFTHAARFAGSFAAAALKRELPPTCC